jgi:putative ABC transport system permease protein
MQLLPILSSLRHHKLTAFLLILQTAFTFAIVINALPMITYRIERIGTSSGLDDDRLSLAYVSGIQKDANQQAQHATDLDALRRIPGVESVAVIGSGTPFSSSANSYGICPSASAWQKAMLAPSFDKSDCVMPDVYNGSPGFAQTMGLHMVQGSGFSDGDYSTGDVATAILTRSLAAKLYPGQSALGKTMFQSNTQIRVVGIVDDVLRPILRDAGQDHLVMLWPQLPNDTDSTYLLRSAPADRERILKAAKAALVKVNPNRLFPEANQRTFAAVRHKYFQRDVTMISLLIASGLGLLFVTALGITGLANFWVQQRRRTIGIRRAIGATRGDILSYFQTENFIIVSFGIVLGMLLAFALNLTLMKFYELPQLPLYYLPIGALALWLLGQLAVLGPALRAAAVSPVVATRSV